MNPGKVISSGCVTSAGCVPRPCAHFLGAGDPHICQHYVHAPNDVKIQLLDDPDPTSDTAVVSWRPSYYGMLKSWRNVPAGFLSFPVSLSDTWKQPRLERFSEVHLMALECLLQGSRSFEASRCPCSVWGGREGPASSSSSTGISPSKPHTLRW